MHGGIIWWRTSQEPRNERKALVWQAERRRHRTARPKPGAAMSPIRRPRNLKKEGRRERLPGTKPTPASLSLGPPDPQGEGMGHPPPTPPAELAQGGSWRSRWQILFEDEMLCPFNHWISKDRPHGRRHRYSGTVWNRRKKILPMGGCMLNWDANISRNLQNSALILANFVEICNHSRNFI